MAELAYVTSKSLEERVDEILYSTDSSIALALMLNTNIKLRAYTFARVQASRSGRERILCHFIKQFDMKQTFGL